MIEGRIPLVNTWCKVKALSAQTCDVDFEDLTIEGILLGFDKSGLIVYPVVGSTVLVGFVDKSKTNGVVLMTTQTERIEIMGSVNKGLVKVDVAKNNMEQLKAYCEAMKTATATALASIDVLLGTTTSTVFNSAMSAAVINLADMENEKVKHGNG